MRVTVAATNIDPALLTALIPLAVIVLALDIVALVDLVRRPTVRGGNKWVWVAIILFISAPVGTILYFMIGRSPDKPDIDFGSPLPIGNIGRSSTSNPAAQPTVTQRGQLLKRQMDRELSRAFSSAIAFISQR